MMEQNEQSRRINEAQEKTVRVCSCQNKGGCTNCASKEEEAEDDDAPTVEMEFAFEESIQEEETTHDEPQWQLSRQYNAAN